MIGEYISGFLITSPGGPDQGLPIPPVYPSHPLPPVEGPVDPGYGVPLPPVVDNGLPNIPGYHPGGGPIRPTYPVDPGYGVPITPGVWPSPPVGIWPPPQPVFPAHPIYPGGGPDNTLPVPPGSPSHPIVLPPGSVWPPLPPQVQGKILAFCWLVGIGYRWVVIDPSLKPDIGLPGSGNKPSTPPTPQPKS
jgi:hypothetical protein